MYETFNWLCAQQSYVFCLIQHTNIFLVTHLCSVFWADIIGRNYVSGAADFSAEQRPGFSRHDSTIIIRRALASSLDFWLPSTQSHFNFHCLHGQVNVQRNIDMVSLFDHNHVTLVNYIYLSPYDPDLTASCLCV